MADLSISPHKPSFDWEKFRSTGRALSIDDLAVFSHASVDNLTVEVAQFLCEQFSVAPQGQRNLTHAYGNLPVQIYRADEPGYGRHHLVRVIQGTEKGFVLLGIIGVLAEYFNEDVIVDFFLKLATNAELPLELSPSHSQWKRLAHVCFGVLFTTRFGVLVEQLSMAGKNDPGNDELVEGLNHTHPQIIVEALQLMSSLAKGEQTGIMLTGGLDAGWYAAVAEWLFDLNVIILAPNRRQINSRVKSSGEGGAELTVYYSNPGIPCDTGVPAIDPDLAIKGVTGGRVIWQTLFRSCFGQDFLDTETSVLAKAIGCAARMTEETISHEQLDQQTYFLSQASQHPGLRGNGLIETITAWFPEFVPLRSRMVRCLKLSMDEAWQEYESQIKTLEASCTCSACGNTAPNAAFCKATIVEIVPSLGLFIARMAVTPELYPKRSGILAFYQRHRASRQARKNNASPAPASSSAKDTLMYLAAFLPTPATMLEAAFLIFAGSIPLGMTPDCLALTHAGISAYVTDYRALGGAPQTLTGVKVTSGTDSFHGRISERALYDEGVAGLSNKDANELIRTKPETMRMISKERGDDMLLSVVRIDTGEIEKAVELGWTVR